MLIVNFTFSINPLRCPPPKTRIPKLFGSNSALDVSASSRNQTPPDAGLSLCAKQLPERVQLQSPQQAERAEPAPLTVHGCVRVAPLLSRSSAGELVAFLVKKIRSGTVDVGTPMTSWQSRSAASFAAPAPPTSAARRWLWSAGERDAQIFRLDPPWRRSENNETQVTFYAISLACCKHGTHRYGIFVFQEF